MPSVERLRPPLRQHNNWGCDLSAISSLFVVQIRTTALQLRCPLSALRQNLPFHKSIDRKRLGQGQPRQIGFNERFKTEKGNNFLKLPSPRCLGNACVPSNIERHIFAETPLTAYRLRNAASFLLHDSRHALSLPTSQMTSADFPFPSVPNSLETTCPSHRGPAGTTSQNDFDARFGRRQTVRPPLDRRTCSPISDQGFFAPYTLLSSAHSVTTLRTR